MDLLKIWKCRFWFSTGLGLSFYMCNKLPGDADADGPWTTLWEVRCQGKLRRWAHLFGIYRCKAPNRHFVTIFHNSVLSEQINELFQIIAITMRQKLLAKQYWARNNAPEPIFLCDINAPLSSGGRDVSSIYVLHFGLVPLEVNVNEYFLPFSSFLSEGDNDNFDPEMEISVRLPWSGLPLDSLHVIDKFLSFPSYLSYCIVYFLKYTYIVA